MLRTDSGVFAKLRGVKINIEKSFTPMCSANAVSIEAVLSDDVDLNGMVAFADFSTLDNNSRGLETAPSETSTAMVWLFAPISTR